MRVLNEEMGAIGCQGPIFYGVYVCARVDVLE